MNPISFWHRLLDLISPRLCAMCGRRLSVTEFVICNKCNYHLPRTDFINNPYENEMAKIFWHQIPIERAAALFYYEGHSEVANIIYRLKYKDEPEIGVWFGRMLAREAQIASFFDEIDGIFPMPLTKKRKSQRGYNQSEEIARGISEVTKLPIYTDIVKRVVFAESQTKKDRWSRIENVENAFVFQKLPSEINHLLVVDDVVTTGFTVISCAKQISQNRNIKISVLSLGYTKK